MAQERFVNNFRTTITSAIGPSDTSIPVSGVAGLPALSNGDWIRATLSQAGTESNWETVKITNASGPLTVVRAFEGTARSWAVGDKLECRVTAGAMDDAHVAANTRSTATSAISATTVQGVVDQLGTAATKNTGTVQGKIPILGENGSLTIDGYVFAKHMSLADSSTNIGVGEVSMDGTSPDTRAYSPFGVTRSLDANTRAFYGMTIAGYFPMGLGLSSTGELVFGVAQADTQRIPDPFMRIGSGGAYFMRAIPSTSPTSGALQAYSLGVQTNLNVGGSIRAPYFTAFSPDLTTDYTAPGPALYLSASYSGGWAYGTFIKDATGAGLGGFGWTGAAQSMGYHYIGPDYADPLVSVNPAGSVETRGVVMAKGDAIGLFTHAYLSKYWDAASSVATTLHTRNPNGRSYEFGILNAAQTAWVLRSDPSGNTYFDGALHAGFATPATSTTTGAIRAYSMGVQTDLWAATLHGSGTGLTGNARALSTGASQIFDSAFTHAAFWPAPDRGASQQPQAYRYVSQYEFKAREGIGLVGVDPYCGVHTVAPWEGLTLGGGGGNYQMAYGSNGGVPKLFMRYGIDTTWNPWREIYTTNADGSIDKPLTFSSTGRHTKKLQVSAESLHSPGANASILVDYGLSFARQFSKSATNYAQGNLAIPYDMDRSIVPTILLGWTCPVNSGAVKWQIEYLWRAIDEDVSSMTPDGTLTVTTTVSATAEGYSYSSFTLAAPSSTDAILVFRIARLGADGADTANDVSHLIGMSLVYVANRLGVTYEEPIP